jgi:DNA-directed RNA polymerase specialized sigma24 family protein
MVKDLITNSHGTSDDTVDVLQDALLILFCNLKGGTYENKSSLSTYLFGICKNLWLTENRRRQKQAIAESEALYENAETFNYLLNTEVVSLLMRELGEDCKNILTEYYFNNRSMAELKEIFNVNSIQAAKNKKWRCMNYLVKVAKEKGVTPTWN